MTVFTDVDLLYVTLLKLFVTAEWAEQAVYNGTSAEYRQFNAIQPKADKKQKIHSKA